MQAIKDGPPVRWATVAPFQICYLRTTHVMQQRERKKARPVSCSYLQELFGLVHLVVYWRHNECFRGNMNNKSSSSKSLWLVFHKEWPHKNIMAHGVMVISARVCWSLHKYMLQTISKLTYLIGQNFAFVSMQQCPMSIEGHKGLKWNRHKRTCPRYRHKVEGHYDNCDRQLHAMDATLEEQVRQSIKKSKR